MSTRANVKIVNAEGETFWLYKHHDGYPTHTGDLIHFEFTNNTSLPYIIDTLVEKGFEPTDQEHGDINWLYVIKLYDRVSPLSNDPVDLDLEVYEYHHESYGNNVNRVKDARFSWGGDSHEVWNRYKLYESKQALEMAKNAIRYYEGICARYDSKKMEVQS